MREGGRDDIKMEWEREGGKEGWREKERGVGERKKENKIKSSSIGHLKFNLWIEMKLEGAIQEIFCCIFKALRHR